MKHFSESRIPPQQFIGTVIFNQSGIIQNQNLITIPYRIKLMCYGNDSSVPELCSYNSFNAPLGLLINTDF
jgi:hypothetical protein